MMRHTLMALFVTLSFADMEAAMADSTKEELLKLVQTLDKDPRPLHSDFTPSVQRLIEIGLPGAAAVVDLLTASEPVTRLHAQRVIEGVVMRRNGWRPNRGYPDRHGEEKTQQILKDNCDYRYDAPPEKRTAAAAKWRSWINSTMAEDAKREHQHQ